MTTSKPALTLQHLREVAGKFADVESKFDNPGLFGVTDGKAVGTYLEHKFQDFLAEHFDVNIGSSASGIDLPGLEVDIKVTSIKQPQSSCPFKSARQKIYGLGYNLLLFVYDKKDDPTTSTARLDILHTVFIAKERTADHQMTRLLLKLLEEDGNTDDIIALFADRNLPVDDIEARQIAEDIKRNPPMQGYLTISNALQWRLQYSRVVEVAGTVDGVYSIRKSNS